LKILSQLPSQVILYLHCRKIGCDGCDRFRGNRANLSAGEYVMLRKNAT
jgi:hypothetical protein